MAGTDRGYSSYNPWRFGDCIAGGDSALDYDLLWCDGNRDRNYRYYLLCQVGTLHWVCTCLLYTSACARADVQTWMAEDVDTDDMEIRLIDLMQYDLQAGSADRTPAVFEFLEWAQARGIWTCLLYTSRCV